MTLAGKTSNLPTAMPSATRKVRPELVTLIQSLKVGQRLKITQSVRVGTTAKWKTVVEGTFRGVNYLATGIATDRIPEDDIVVVCIHFTKDNGELSSITLEELTQIEVLV